MISYQILDRCPRCNGEWEKQASNIPPSENYFKCRTPLCYTEYWDNETGPILLCYVNFLYTGDELSWDWDTNDCGYWKYNPTGENSTRLPWLGFDITPEKLKLYLLFS